MLVNKIEISLTKKKIIVDRHKNFVQKLSSSCFEDNTKIAKFSFHDIFFPPDEAKYDELNADHYTFRNF